ncbi:hypothetical protein GLAREA_03396 [Glarea lozoyensis ATCC 20868]|uniref:Uncharacterized protein n=1 Tax=Glarea lozoyensis (strain ATCC 20868 / MF5171) TaxID=1116229 RepID=S3CZV2_GLAL2|nr:uncharacterized protein GLAREA_03396 [Glarea lozoyensis ATCC 20868]EPE30429.1 hypothetical protein GLAREA_03396 [Glarea lozoyensis ATCC 20868]
MIAVGTHHTIRASFKKYTFDGRILPKSFGLGKHSPDQCILPTQVHSTTFCLAIQTFSAHLPKTRRCASCKKPNFESATIFEFRASLSSDVEMYHAAILLTPKVLQCWKVLVQAANTDEAITSLKVCIESITDSDVRSLKTNVINSREPHLTALRTRFGNYGDLCDSDVGLSVALSSGRHYDEKLAEITFWEKQHQRMYFGPRSPRDERATAMQEYSRACSWRTHAERLALLSQIKNQQQQESQAQAQRESNPRRRLDILAIADRWRETRRLGGTIETLQAMNEAE